MTDSKGVEILEELRTVFSVRGNLLDSLLPPVLFLVVYGLFGFEAATWTALGLALIIMIGRLLRRHAWTYAIGGVVGVLFAMLVARGLGRAEGYFLPGILSTGLTVLLCMLSILLGKPLVAWTSYLARRWPLDWYWHERVRPAYNEVTLAWALFFLARFAIQFGLFQNQDTRLLALVSLLTGWPAILVLLVGSYLYGTWRLRQLKGPSVEEYRTGAGPPWSGQRRGF